MSDRYGVVHHDDQRGRWYAVVDKQKHTDIAHSRSQSIALGIAEVFNDEREGEPGLEVDVGLDGAVTFAEAPADLNDYMPNPSAARREGWWGMACWNALSAEQQTKLLIDGYLPIGYEPEGDGCTRGARVNIETMFDVAPGPRFYCIACAVAFLRGLDR